ncbi:MAG: GAF domain-containing protein, partial [Verrucomicrobia bacterium]|nr:GAF domain-containing protein [Verrucomicrobiota bacterium]
MTGSFESKAEIACVNPSIRRLIHSEPDSYLDDLVALASQICETPIAVISMLDGDRIWFKSRVGIAMIIAPIDRSLCKQVLCGNELVVVPDTHLREELRGHPVFHGSHPIRFFAGLPLRGSSGDVFGAFCLMDHQPREIAEEQRNALWRFARLAVERIEWLISQQPSDTGRTAPEHLGGCRVQSAGCRVQGAGCRVQGAGCRVQGAGCRVQGAGCRVQGAGCRVQGNP